MSKKKWLDMKIIRVKLNPEQAVLQCCVVEALQPIKHGYALGPMGEVREYCTEGPECEYEQQSVPMDRSPS